MEKFDKTTRKQYRTKVEEEFPDTFQWGDLQFKKKLAMRYGENPGYPAAFYQEPGASGPNMASLEAIQEGSKGLSYINIGDMDLGLRLVKKLSSIYPHRHICVLVKHEMPSGVAMGKEPAEVFQRAWDCDSLSNFGSVDVFNHMIEKSLAEIIVEKGRNVEVVFAPGFSQDALDVLATRKPLRVVKLGAPIDMPSQDNGLEFKRVEGGFLIQKRFDSKIISPESVEIVSERIPTEREVEAAIFCWTVACFTRSNAIVIGTADRIHGIGSGQRSRIDAAEDAIKFSKRGYGSEGCVMASDAFMPFTDVVELAAKNGIKAIIYPLGSIRDEEVLQKANELGLAMIITKKSGETDSERCFLHR
jgi:AICAR transformylase/IMP cyclohydrolase PurH